MLSNEFRMAILMMRYDSKLVVSRLRRWNDWCGTGTIEKQACLLLQRRSSKVHIKK